METSTDYNGYANYSTWNVSLFMCNVESVYHLVKRYDTWEKAKEVMSWHGITQTSDGVSFDSPDLNTDELDEVLAELS